jgi:hypothetical protein
MRKHLDTFLRSENGAVTVDWVVLTAAVVGLGMLVLTPIAFSTDSAFQRVANSIADLDTDSSNN